MFLDASILTLSLLCQVGAALMALRLARLTGGWGAWSLVAMAVFLMAIRRSITLSRLVFTETSPPPDRIAELVALLISVLMVVGLLWLLPLFQEARSNYEASRISEAQFRHILDNMMDVFYRTDMEGRLLMTSRSSEQVFGFPLGEIIGRQLSDLYVNPNDREKFLEALEAGGGVVKDFQAPLRHKRGGEVWVSTNARYLRDDAGRIVGVEGVTRDITEQRRLLRQSQLVERLQTVEKLAGGIAHDFNNLLQVIAGHLELMREETTLSPEMVTMIERMERACEKAADLVQQMLAFGKRRVMERQPVELADVVADIRNMMERLTDEGIRVTIQTEEGPRVQGDRSALVQVMLNMCLNARQAMPDGGDLFIALALEPGGESFRREHSWAVEGAYGVLTIRDSGQGIPTNVRDRIFDPFFTTRKVGEGSGLGLAMAHAIVEEHEGTIEVDSSEGGGSEFRIYLPIRQEGITS